MVEYMTCSGNSLKTSERSGHAEAQSLSPGRSIELNSNVNTIITFATLGAAHAMRSASNLSAQEGTSAFQDKSDVPHTHAHMRRIHLRILFERRSRFCCGRPSTWVWRPWNACLHPNCPWPLTSPKHLTSALSSGLFLLRGVQKRDLEEIVGESNQPRCGLSQ